MTAPAISLTQSQIFAALRSAILSILPDGIEVVLAQINRVPEPRAADFVVMTPILRERLATNVVSYADLYPGPTTQSIAQSTRLTIQLDIHGPASAETAQILSTLMRDALWVDRLAPFGIAPLEASDPRQTPFHDAEQQIEFRWSIDAVVQATIAITVTQDFADHLTIGLIEVDERYPP